MVGDQVDPTRRRLEDQPGAEPSEPGGTDLLNITTNTQRSWITPSPSQSNTANHVVDERPPPIKADNSKKRSRFKWTEDMNRCLYRTYLIITELETNKNKYGHELYKRMTETFPELKTKTMQNILDQRRSLFITNRLSRDVVENIRREVSQELGVATNITPQPDIPQQIASPSRDTPNNIEILLEENIMKYEGIRPDLKDQIPRIRATKNTLKIISEINKLLLEKSDKCATLETVHELIYAAAVTIAQLHGEQKGETANKNGKTHITRTTPNWERRLNNKIQETRKCIGVLTQYGRDNPSKRVKNQASVILNKYKDDRNESAEEIMDKLKQKLAVFSIRLRRYKKSSQRKLENKAFEKNQHGFYRNLENSHHNNVDQNNKHPENEDLKKFWSNIWEKPSTYKASAGWIKLEQKRLTKIPQMTPKQINAEDVKRYTSKTKNWKTPGPDKIQNFWYKKLTSTHKQIANLLNDLLKHPEKTPAFMTTGTTYLIPKTHPSQNNPSKYRPITCLPTIYKIMTGIIAEKIYEHLEDNNLIAEEQKGCRKQAQGCKEQLTIDQIITKHAKKHKKDLHVAYIDYQKAFDSVPHQWLNKVLSIYKIDTGICKFLEAVMGKWKTNLVNQTNESIPISIRRGIFQGDALSALWFCLSINPLSTAVNNKNIGYSLTKERKISHLMYMDDIKLYAESEKELTRLLRAVEEFTNDTSMTFGIEKCKINSMGKGKWVPSEGIKIRKTEQSISGMEKDETYKYLGFAQSHGIEIQQTKKQLTTELIRRARLILKSELTGKNKIQAINTYAVPALTFSFGVIEWSNTDLETINRSLRKEFTKYRAHHPRACKERFHLPRSVGGRGVTDLREIYERQTLNLKKYFIDMARTSDFHRAITKKDENLTPLNLSNNILTENKNFLKEKLENWQKKELHGRYANTLERPEINKDASLAWLNNSGIFAETEGFACAIQDQVIPTKSYLKYIIKEPKITNTKCRMCKEAHENIEHIISGCKNLAPKEYTNRHNDIAKIIHIELCVKYNLMQGKKPYYRYIPESIMENEKVKIYWDRTLYTDHSIQHNRPDICVLNKDKNILTIIDVAVPAPVNIENKNNEKIRKYLPLSEEIKTLWNLDKVEIIPIVIGTTGEIPWRLNENLEILELENTKQICNRIQKITILTACNIVRKVLNIKT